ncbi:hypothetical protein GGU10DRAFT_389726 [Lentinula aff. detonsa]|uniref:Uncharacterized protein n=1 Tax=Lentinula aff. detonsa TaxID=2804958 RepID=A0AA38KUS6_9AGAR|nr:hypothetical protein GGU10DRAFT_389726 [Lentinula aff. detonsa]
MHRSWPLLSLAFIVLISLSSVCTIPVETNLNPQLHSRGLSLNGINTSSLSSSAIKIEWKSSQNKLASPTPEQLVSITTSEKLAKTKMHTLMKNAQDVLGLILGESSTIQYDSNPSFASALDYAYQLVKFQITVTGGTKCEGKVFTGLLYLGSDPDQEAFLRRGQIKCGVEQVFPMREPHHGGP